MSHTLAGFSERVAEQQHEEIGNIFERSAVFWIASHCSEEQRNLVGALPHEDLGTKG